MNLTEFHNVNNDKEPGIEAAITKATGEQT